MGGLSADVLNLHKNCPAVTSEGIVFSEAALTTLEENVQTKDPYVVDVESVYCGSTMSDVDHASLSCRFCIVCE